MEEMDDPRTATFASTFQRPAQLSQTPRSWVSGPGSEERPTRAPGNGAPIDGLKVTTANGWFAARPSGTENIDKIYAESFRDETHLQTIVTEAEQLVTNALESSR